MFVEPTMFREYDIRGVASRDLTEGVVELIGKAYGTYIQDFGISRVVVGRDNRKSSKRIRDSLVKGLVQVGCDIIDIGLVVSPIFYFSLVHPVRKDRFSNGVHYKKKGGVMITASHNPPEFNGLKLCKGGYQSIYGREIQKIREIVEKGKFKALPSAKQGKVSFLNPEDEYANNIKEKIKLKRKLKAVVDCGNGTAGLFAPKILRDLGVEIVELHCASDPNFPHHLPDPSKPENVEDLRTKVLEEKADLGLAFDGDADRIGVIDEKGKIIWGDQLLILFTRELLAKKPGEKIIIEVKCSQSLYDDVKAHGGKPMFSKTGHALIKAKMEKEKVLLTGEMSGHMYFADEYYGFDDAIYAAGRLLRLIAESGKKLSEMFTNVAKYFSTPEMYLPCPDREKFKIVKDIVKFFKKKYEVIDVDGARVVFPDGWGLVRASNTMPALVARMEGRTPEALERIKKIIFDKLREYPSIQL